jgi:hypothetical protein
MNKITRQTECCVIHYRRKGLKRERDARPPVQRKQTARRPVMWLCRGHYQWRRLKYERGPEHSANTGPLAHQWHTHAALTKLWGWKPTHISIGSAKRCFQSTNCATWNSLAKNQTWRIMQIWWQKPFVINFSIPLWSIMLLSNCNAFQLLVSYIWKLNLTNNKNNNCHNHIICSTINPVSSIFNRQHRFCNFQLFSASIYLKLPDKLSILLFKKC